MSETHRALSIDSLAGLMLPCNVTVEEGSTGKAIVRIANPETMMQAGSLSGQPELVTVAKEARTRLERVARKLLE